MNKKANDLHLEFYNMVDKVAVSQSNLVPKQPSEATPIKSNTDNLQPALDQTNADSNSNPDSKQTTLAPKETTSSDTTHTPNSADQVTTEEVAEKVVDPVIDTSEGETIEEPSNDSPSETPTAKKSAPDKVVDTSEEETIEEPSNDRHSEIPTSKKSIPEKTVDEKIPTKREKVKTASKKTKQKNYKRKKKPSNLSIYTLLADYEEPPSQEKDFTSIRVICKKTDFLKILHPELSRMAIYDKIATEYLQKNKAKLKSLLE